MQKAEDSTTLNYRQDQLQAFLQRKTNIVTALYPIKPLLDTQA